MSYYQGPVAKLVLNAPPKDPNKTEWQVVKVVNIDTSLDENMNFNFQEGDGQRGTWIPVTLIGNYYTGVKIVTRRFNPLDSTERWEAQ